MALALSEPLEDLVTRLLAEAPSRVRSLTLPDGRRFWLKQVEAALPLRMRLQKGNVRAAFEAERTGLRVLGQNGLPVAPIALDGPDYILLPDVGRTLNLVLADAPEEEQARAFRAAGLSLARLHRAGFVHGRPAIRDICWDGTEARFIDLERFSPKRQGRLHQAMDVIIFVQTVMTAAGAHVAALDEALAAYEAAAPEGMMVTVRRLAGMAWLAWPGGAR
ncbi:MAG: serine/threonine protein phosphatase, partial [Tabrizicola sp.]|nr:serine/threonine protein phosphatase [Tabrizicola sp.]